MEDLLVKIALYVGSAITIANAITACFPSVGENKYYNIVMKILNFISINVLKNKNADDK